MSNSVDGDPLDNVGPLTQIFKAGPLQQWRGREHCQR